VNGPFKKETEVSTQLLNLGKDITYLGAGDSGGGVFREVNGQAYVVGVNHSSFFGNAEGLPINPFNGLVHFRPPKHLNEPIGFAHTFVNTNTKLITWISKILPKSRYVIE
jgi:hypothetical protein